MATALPESLPGCREGRPSGAGGHHGDDGTRFGRSLSRPGCGPGCWPAGAAGRCGRGGGPGPGGWRRSPGRRWCCRGGGCAARLRPDACAAAGRAAVAPQVCGGGDLRGAGAAGGRAEGGRGGGPAAAAGAGTGRPVLERAGVDGTARGWSRFAGRAGWLRPALLGLLPLADPQARPVAPAGSPSGDALAALEAVTAGLRRRFRGWPRWRRMRWPRT